MSMDTEYLKAAVGNALSSGLTSTVSAMPVDPVDYLAQRLLKWVEDSHAKTAAIAAEEEAKDKQVRAADAAAVAEREKKQRRGSTASKVQKEDDRLVKLLDAASSSAEVLNASLEFLRGRLGTSAYVTMTDLPDKTIPLEEPVDPETAAAAEGEEAAEALGEPAEGEEAPAEEAPPEGEPPEPPPPRVPFVPKVLVYEAATENDRKTLVGKTLSRPAKPEGEEDNEEAAPVRGQTEPEP